MTSRKWHSAFRGTRWILQKHGLITWLLYWFTGLISLVTVSHWARWLPNYLPVIGETHDNENGKTKAWLQDSAALLVFGATGVAIYITWCGCMRFPDTGAWVAAYLILDSLSRHVRMMWFDDLEPWMPKKRREVWSHRRILFLGIISYALSIVLFTSLLHEVDHLQHKAFITLLERSFGTATLLSLPRSISEVDAVQVIISLFYLAIVVATTASIAYRRGEVASDD